MALYNACEWIIIGISGVTCGGKTTLAGRLRQLLRPVWLLHQDRYFYPDDSPHHVRCADLEHNNYDILSALDMEAMRRDMLRLLAGDSARPDQDAQDVQDVQDTQDVQDAQDGQGARTLRVPGKKFLVVEGFTVLNYKPIADMCDLKYYLTLDLGTCQARRSLRLYEPADVPGYFEQCVWPEHLKYKKEMKRDTSVRFLSGADPDVLEHVSRDLQQLAARAGAIAHSTAAAGRSDAPCVTVGAPPARARRRHGNHGNDGHGNDGHGNAHEHAGNSSESDDADDKGKRPGKGKKEKKQGCVGETCLLDKSCGKQVFP